MSKKLNDPIVEWKKCCLSWQDFPIYQSDLEFYDKVSPILDVDEQYAKEFLEKNNDIKDCFEYKDGKLKAKIPTPILCPEERYRKKIAFRNELSLYKRTCSMTWKSIVSIYSPDKKYTVYDQNMRRSDVRDPEDLSKNINLDEKFLQQFKELFYSVPMISLQNIQSENSEYCALGWNNKNCYLIVWNTSENCCYGIYWTKNTDCFDTFFVSNSSNCYEIIDANNCYEVSFSQNIQNCKYSYFLTNCINCTHCFGCVNLCNKEYYIYNSPVSKKDFDAFIKKNLYNRDFINKEQEKIRQLRESLPRENMNISNVDERSFGNNLSYAENVQMWFDSTGTENPIKDCKYISLSTTINDCYDIVDSWNNSSLCYEALTFTWKSILFSSNIFDSYDILYSNMCQNCNHCFGCVWLRNKNYCILNKQYSEHEYYQIVPKIIANMIRDKTRWSFFTADCSPFWYNETIAIEEYPLKKEEALKMWYKRSDYESPMPHVEKIVKWKDLPIQWCKIIREKTPEILEKILNYAVICEVSWKPFRITKQEIDFYIKHNLPLPRKHPNVRHQERINKRWTKTLNKWICSNCSKEILYLQTPWKNKMIYCKTCYQKYLSSN